MIITSVILASLLATVETMSMPGVANIESDIEIDIILNVEQRSPTLLLCTLSTSDGQVLGVFGGSDRQDVLQGLNSLVEMNILQVVDPAEDLDTDYEDDEDHEDDEDYEDDDSLYVPDLSGHEICETELADLPEFNIVTWEVDS